MGIFHPNVIIVMKRFVWIYATVQFMLVVFFAHLFYSYVSRTQICADEKKLGSEILCVLSM